MLISSLLLSISRYAVFSNNFWFSLRESRSLLHSKFYLPKTTAIFFPFYQVAWVLRHREVSGKVKTESVIGSRAISGGWDDRGKRRVFYINRAVNWSFFRWNDVPFSRTCQSISLWLLFRMTHFVNAIIYFQGLMQPTTQIDAFHLQTDWSCQPVIKNSD